MPYLDRITLVKIAILPDIAGAKLGSLIQISTNGISIPDNDQPAVVGLRCNIQHRGGLVAGLTLLESKWAGVFLTDDELFHRPAIDVSNIAEIVLSHPSPQTASAKTVVAGDVCHAKDGQDKNELLCMAVRLADRPDLVGYAPLVGQERGKITGVVRQFYVGKAEVIPVKTGLENDG